MEYLSWIDRALPLEKRQADPRELTHARLVVVIGLAFSVITLPWFALLIAGDPVIRPPRLIALVVIGLLALNPLWLRLTSTRSVAWATLVLLHVAMISNTALNGGFQGPVGVTLASLPVVAGVLLGHRAGWIDAGLIFGVAAAMGWYNQVGALPTTAPEEHWPLVRMMSLAIAVGLMMLAVSAHGRLLVFQNRELATARDAALRASRAKSRFLSTMSHEMRTPMVGVVGATELLLRSEGWTAGQHDLLRGLRQSADAQLKLIGNVLDLSRIESDRIELEQRATSPRQILAEIASLFHLTSKEKGLKLHLDISERVPAWVVTDAFRLRQILSNLVGNAIKFTERGSITIHADADQGSGHTWLTFKIVDTGIGFDSETAEQLFSEFSQADGSTTRKFGGSGLGLSICRHLVEMMGGAIRAEGSPGRGATFTFQIPVQHAEGPATESANLPALAPKGMRVLLADDEPINRMVIAGMLEELGHDVLEAEDGEQVLKLTEAEDVDLIILDMHMPKLDGPDCARALRAREAAAGDPRGLPLLGLTADATVDNRLQYLESGLDALYTKPIEIDTLGLAISQAYSRMP